MLSFRLIKGAFICWLRVSFRDKVMEIVEIGLVNYRQPAFPSKKLFLPITMMVAPSKPSVVYINCRRMSKSW